MSTTRNGDWADSSTRPPPRTDLLTTMRRYLDVAGNKTIAAGSGGLSGRPPANACARSSGYSAATSNPPVTHPDSPTTVGRSARPRPGAVNAPVPSSRPVTVPGQARTEQSSEPALDFLHEAGGIRVDHPDVQLGDTGGAERLDALAYVTLGAAQRHKFGQLGPGRAPGCGSVSCWTGG